MRFRLILGALLLGGAAYFALFGGEYNVLEVQRIRNEYRAEQERSRQLEAEIARLRARVDSLQNDSATIERIARERWGLIRPGERLYRFEEADPVQDSARRDTTRHDSTNDRFDSGTSVESPTARGPEPRAPD